MKKISIIICVLFCSAVCFGQPFPLTQNLGSPTTLIDVKGGIRPSVGFINTPYADTNAANANTYLKNYPGAQIRTITPTNTLWFRNAAATAWIQIASGVISTANIYNSNGVLTSNRLLSGRNNYNLLLDSLTSFGVNTPTGNILFQSDGNLEGVSANGAITFTALNGAAALQNSESVIQVNATGDVVLSAPTDSVRVLHSNSIASLGAYTLLASSPTGGLVKYTGSIGGGGMQSIGAGYGVSVFQDSIVLADSATLSQYYLRIKDSTSLANPTGYVKGKVIMGDVVSTAFTSVSGFTQTTGTASFSYGAGGVTISGGNGTRQSNKLVSTYISMSNDYGILSEFTVNTTPADHTQGLDIGKFGSTPNISLYLTYKFVDATHCRLGLRVVNGPGNGSAFDSTATLPMTAGNKYRVYARQSNNGVYYKLALLVGGIETEVVDDMYDIALNTAYVLPSIGSVGLDVLGGNYTVSLLKQTNFDVFMPDILYIGTSITQGHYPTTFAQHYTSLVHRNTDVTYSNFGQGGSQLQYLMSGKNEVLAIKPKYVILEQGVNDQCSDIRAFAVPYIDTLQAHGITVIWLQDFTSVCKDSVIYNICVEQVVQLVNPGKTMVAGMYTDGVHPNDYGNTHIAKYERAELAYIFKQTGNVDQYTLNSLKDIKFNGLLDGDLLRYNGTTSQFNNVAPTSITSFINNQFSTQQVANFWIGGSARINAEAGFGGAPVSQVPIATTENTTGGAGIRIYNTDAVSSSGVKYMQLTQYGSAAFGIPALVNASALINYTNGGLVLGSYTQGIKFIFGSLYTERAAFNSSGQLGIGIAQASIGSNLHSVATTEQLRLGYDGSNYLKSTTASTGSTTFDLVGTAPVLTIADSLTLTSIAQNIVDTTNWKILVIAGGGQVKKMNWAFAGGGGGGGGVSAVAGTANRISSTGGATPQIDIDGAYVGQTSMTTLGTITTGVWSGTDIALADGGTGATLSDPGANKFLAWDDTDNSMGFWTIGSGLSYDHATHTISSTGGSGVTQAVITDTLQNYWRLNFGNTTTPGSQAGSFIGSVNNTTLRFRTNNTQKMMLDSVAATLIIGSPTYTASTFGAIIASPTNNTSEGVKIYSNNNSANIAIGYQRIQTSGDLELVPAGNDLLIGAGRTMIGSTTPGQAILQVAAGTTSQAPLKLTSGTHLTTTEAGAIEYNGTHLYFTAANAGTRFQLDQQTGTVYTGTANQVIVTGTVLSTPQDIATTSGVQFGSLGVGTTNGGPSYNTTFGATVTLPTSGNGAVVRVTGTLVENSSGTHALISGTQFSAPTITGGAATVTDAATVTILGAPTATVTGNNYSLNIQAGNSFLGDKVSLAVGSNKSVGVSGAMTAGTITISTTAVTASSLIFLTHATTGGTTGILTVGTITPGTSFVINSSSATDTGSANWWIIN